MKKILVWDLPTRIGHWLLVTAFVLAFMTGDGEKWRLVHVAAGYAVAGIVVFRMFWGVAGTRYARFTSFLFSPRAVFTYLGDLLQGKPGHWVGHNPAGSYAIYILILLGLATTASGFAVYAEIGGEWLEEAHDVLSYTMLGMVCFHVLGVVVSSLMHHENLVRSMLDGYKQGKSEEAITSSKIHWAIAPIVSAVLASLLVFIT
ncbi:MAG: cytochrome b/b6 domain-containing protein [Nitrosomonadales bacterium]|nr:cytochrome b/b6 domain-containing protein [Nitrosomonadales bacterium]